MVHVMLKASMQDFKHDLTSMGDECNCPIFLTFFNIAFLGNWNEDWPFPDLWPVLGLRDLQTYWVQHFDSIILKVMNSFNGIPSHPLALLTAVLHKTHLNSHSGMSGSGWWPHHCGYPGHWDFFVQFFCIFFPSLLDCFLLLLSLNHFCPLLYPSLGKIFPRYFQFSWRDP